MNLKVADAKREEGFTLIELLVVVIIIGILAAIAIPIFLNQREKARDSAVQSTLRSAGTYMEIYYTDDEAGGFDVYPTTEAELAAVGFRSGDNVIVDEPFNVTTENDRWCIEAHHLGDDTRPWHLDSDAGTPDQSACPAF